MISIAPAWLVLALITVVAALYLAHRIGLLSAHAQVAELEGRCAALTEQLATRGTLDATLQPLKQAMQGLSAQVDAAERERVQALTGLSERVLSVGRQLGEATRDVQQQAQRITQALSRTQNQGTWGEMQLRQLVEASGMIDHVHFGQARDETGR